MIVVESMGHRGEGIAWSGGQAVYIPYALPGETITARFAGNRGRLDEVVQASAERIAPFCPHFGTCGGCLLQHWAPRSYRDWKRDLVIGALRQRGIQADVAGLVDAHGEGRRRAGLHARRRGPGAVAGFMGARSHDLHDIDRCPILEPALARAPEMAREIAEAVGDVDLSMTATEGGIDVTLKGAGSIGERARLALIGLADRLGLARLSLHHEPLVERAAPLVAMGRAKVKLPPVSFLQATRAGEEALASLVSAGVGKAGRIADLFCGVGPFALRLAERADVLAVDNDRAAIDALTRAARSAPGLKPLKAERRDLFARPLLPRELEAFDAVIFDPPRAGAEPQARQLARSRVKTVIAVSCDRGTFAHDAAILIAGGYRLASVTPVDQFAWSAHVEIVGVFRR